MRKLHGLLGAVALCALSAPAWAGTASVNLPIQVKQAPAQTSVACDVGPPYVGTIPGPAAALGFTHCLNFDFTYTGNFSNTKAFLSKDATDVVQAGQAWNWATPSSWLNTAGASNSSAIFQGNSSNSSSSNQIVSDGGQNALLIQFVAGDSNTTGLDLNVIFPNTNSFIEEDVKIDPNAWKNIASVYNGEIIDDFGFWTGVNNPGPGNGLEVDGPILCGQQTSRAAWSTTGDTSPCGIGVIAWGTRGIQGEPGIRPPAGVSWTDGNYHIVGFLVAASRTQNKISFCGYSDKHNATDRGDPEGTNCLGVYYKGSNFCNDTPYACYQSGTTSIGNYITGATANTGKQWFRRVTIWTCPGWAITKNSQSNTCDAAVSDPSFSFPNGAPGPSY
jgi:hypothetical protein